MDFHRRTVCPGPLDTEAAYRLTWFIYRRKYEDRLPWYVAPKDLVQEGVLRLFEMAGHPRFQEKGFQFYLALNAMKGWIERQRRMQGGIGGTTPGADDPAHGQGADSHRRGCMTWAKSKTKRATWGHHPPE